MIICVCLCVDLSGISEPVIQYSELSSQEQLSSRVFRNYKFSFSGYKSLEITVYVLCSDRGILQQVIMFTVLPIKFLQSLVQIGIC